MFIEIATIHDWMSLKYDSSLYKSRSLTQNIARLCVKKSVLKKLAMPTILQELKAAGIPDEDITSQTSTYIQFALPFCVDDSAFCEKKRDLANRLRTHMTSKFGFLLKENKDDNLQSLIIGLLNNRDYRLKSSVYYAAKNGHDATFDVLDKIDNVWSLRA